MFVHFIESVAIERGKNLSTQKKIENQMVTDLKPTLLCKLESTNLGG